MKRRRRREIIAEYFKKTIGRRKRPRRETPEDCEDTEGSEEVSRGQGIREDEVESVKEDETENDLDLSEVIDFLADQKGDDRLPVDLDEQVAREETEEVDVVDPEIKNDSNLDPNEAFEPLADQSEDDHLSGDLEEEGDEEEPTDEIVSVRSATAKDGVDLTGTWKPVVTEVFKSQYDAYLKNCSETYMFRQVVVNGIGYLEETMRQLDGGKNLQITATNPVGDWNRTLVTSPEDAPLQVAIIDPDKDECLVEAYWIDNGTRHKSLLKGKPRVKGGVFETIRYLDDGGDNLICESYFHPGPNAPAKFKPAHVVWNFTRVA